MGTGRDMYSPSISSTFLALLNDNYLSHPSLYDIIFSLLSLSTVMLRIMVLDYSWTSPSLSPWLYFWWRLLLYLEDCPFQLSCKLLQSSCNSDIRLLRNLFRHQLIKLKLSVTDKCITCKKSYQTQSFILIILSFANLGCTGSEKQEVFGNPASAFTSGFKMLENLFTMIKKPHSKAYSVAA